MLLVFSTSPVLCHDLSHGCALFVSRLLAICVLPKCRFLGRYALFPACSAWTSSASLPPLCAISTCMACAASREATISARRLREPGPMIHVEDVSKRVSMSSRAALRVSGTATGQRVRGL